MIILSRVKEKAASFFFESVLFLCIGEVIK